MINSKIFDQNDDLNGQQLYRLSKLYLSQFPDFVKQASSDDIYADDNLLTYQFADPTNRRFPCHTAPATYISTLFFMNKRADIEQGLGSFIADRLDNFAFFHGISDSINSLKDTIVKSSSVVDTKELTDDDFALVIDVNNSKSGTHERHYPMRNAIEVKKAAEYLENYADIFPYEYRYKMANKILEKANQYGASLGDLDVFLEKQAGLGVASSEDIGEFLFNRARLLKRAGKIEYAIKVAELAKIAVKDQVAQQDHDQLVKLAILIDQVDRETGLARFVDDLPKIEDALFSVTVKQASELREQHFATRNGNIYNIADVERLKLADVRDVMGDNFAQAISTGGLFVSPEKMAEIVPTLPMCDAELFDQLLTSVGINAVAKEAAHFDDSLAQDELSALATLHSSN